jgi:hypothetical protein
MEVVWAAVGALIFGCLLLLIYKLKRRRSARIFGYFMIVCGILFAGVKWAEWHVARRSQLRNLAAGLYETVEGTIEDFHPMPKDGSSNESFTISGHTFSYSDNDELEATPCFNQTALNGGPIRPGMMVRVKANEGCILRIEILPENWPRLPKS